LRGGITPNTISAPASASEALRDCTSRQLESGQVDFVDALAPQQLHHVGTVRPYRQTRGREERVSATASAVPQLPPPMMAIFFTVLTTGSENAVPYRHQPSIFFAVLHDHQRSRPAVRHRYATGGACPGAYRNRRARRAAAADTDASETYRQKERRSRKPRLPPRRRPRRSSGKRPAGGYPLPPENFSHTGKTWPKIAAVRVTS